MLANIAICLVVYFMLAVFLFAICMDDFEYSNPKDNPGHLTGKSFATLVAVFWPIVVPVGLVIGLCYFLTLVAKAVYHAFKELWSVVITRVEKRVS